MIEPVRLKPNTFDISCSRCGTIERFECRWGQLVPFAKAKGWRMLAGRHYCPDVPGFPVCRPA